MKCQALAAVCVMFEFMAVNSPSVVKSTLLLWANSGLTGAGGLWTCWSAGGRTSRPLQRASWRPWSSWDQAIDCREWSKEGNIKQKHVQSSSKQKTVSLHIVKWSFSLPSACLCVDAWSELLLLHLMDLRESSFSKLSVLLLFLTGISFSSAALTDRCFSAAELLDVGDEMLYTWALRELRFLFWPVRKDVCLFSSVLKDM